MVLIIITLVMVSLYTANGHNYRFSHPSSKIITMNADPNLGFINVKSPPYNATGNGITDDTNAIQQALNDIGAVGGGIVFVPEGNYLIATHLTLLASTVLKGVASHVQRDWGDPSRKRVSGTTLLAIADAGNETGTPFISLSGHNSGIEGLQIFYPNQVITTPPIAYPWTIRCGQKGMRIENNFVKDVLLVNPWKGIDAATNQSPRHWFENIYGQPLSIGIAVDQCYDIGRIVHIHFYSFWSVDPAFRAWINNNGVSFIFQRTDWEIVEDVFSFGYHTGMAFRSSVYGSCNGQFTDINFDQVDIGIDVSYTQTEGILFSNLNLANAGGGSIRFGILGRQVNGTHSYDASVIIRGASFWGHFEQNIVWSHPGLISISDSLFIAWNQSKPCIDIQAGRAMINNNYFKDSIGNAITVHENADRVTITNNQLINNTLNIVTKPNILVANNLP
jgi:hypothetical protein